MSPESLPLFRSSRWPRRLASHLRGPLAALLCAAPLAFAAPAIEPARFERLTQQLQAEVDQGHVAGIAVLVADREKILYRHNAGFADIAAKQPLADDSLYKLFSLTKPVTAVALMMLYDEGKFALDDPLHKHLPQFEGLQVAKADGPDGMPLTEAPAHPVTVREVLSHTGGFTYGLFSQSQVDSLYVARKVQETGLSYEERMQRLAAIPLRQQPGTLWHYSVSSEIQAALVEKLSGMGYEAFVRSRILEPLQMNDSGFHVSGQQAPRLTTSYARDEAGALQPLPKQQYLSAPAHASGGGGFADGSGGLLAPIDDYLKFARMLLGDGETNGVRLLKADTARLMRSNQLPAGVEAISAFFPGNQFGLGAAVVSDSAAAGHLPQGTYWWWGVQGPWMWVDPQNGLVTLGMLQHTDYLQSRRIHGTLSATLYGPAQP